MPNEFEELLKGQEVLGTMADMSAAAANKIMHMLFVVDISASMGGSRINKVNEAFRKMIPALQGIQHEVNDAFELNIAVMTFGSNATWTVMPTPILQYSHTDLKANGGGTNYTEAFRTLEEKLSVDDKFMAHKGKIAEPYIMFMTDGSPNDSTYDSVLEELEKNIWYAHSQRYAVLIGEDAIHNSKARGAVEKFVSDKKEGIVTAEEAEEIVAVVSAKTIHTIKGMTLHRQHGIAGEETKKGGSGTAPGPESGSSTADPVYGEKWEFNPEDVYGSDWSGF